jgi:hypothetical protein
MELVELVSEQTGVSEAVKCTADEPAQKTNPFTQQ